MSAGGQSYVGHIRKLAHKCHSRYISFRRRPKFNFVSPSSRIRKRPGRLNRSRKKKRKNTEGRTPGFPLLRWNEEEEELFLLHKTAPPTSYSTHVRTRCIIFIFFERKEKEDVE
jgi:hypothetical protein